MNLDAMKMYNSTIVTLEGEKGRKYIHDGWSRFVYDNILRVGNNICWSLEFALDRLFVEIERANK